MPTSRFAIRLNGLDLGRLYGTIDALRGNPGLSRFLFRARNRWLEGPRSQSRIQSLHGAGGEQRVGGEGFLLESDSAPVLFGEDRAASPEEYLLHALASSLSSTLVAQAALRGVELDGVETAVEAEFDLAVMLAEQDPVQPPLQRIRVRMRIDSEAADEQVEALFASLRQRCPVLLSLSSAVELRWSRSLAATRPSSVDSIWGTP